MTDVSRRDAGRRLAATLREYAAGEAVVVGIARGGLVVAAEVAGRLHLSLETLVVQKLPCPRQPRLYLGVVAEPAHLVVNRPGLRAAHLDATWLNEAVPQAWAEVRRRGRAIRGGRGRCDLEGRRVILIDDAAATGMTLRVSLRAVRTQGAREIIVAVPVAPPQVVEVLGRQADRVVCLVAPGALLAGGFYYPCPGDVSDEDARRLLERHERAHL